jgi:hypothetical protein
MKQCPVCLKNFPHLEEHHIFPQCYGGPKDGPLLEICSTCHQHLHYQAENLVAKTAKRKHYFNPEDWTRAEPYVAIIIMSKRFYLENKPPTMKKIQLNIDNMTLELLKIKSRDNGYSNMQQYLFDLIKNHVRKDV